MSFADQSLDPRRQSTCIRFGALPLFENLPINVQIDVIITSPFLISNFCDFMSTALRCLNFLGKPTRHAHDCAFERICGIMSDSSQWANIKDIGLQFLIKLNWSWQPVHSIFLSWQDGLKEIPNYRRLCMYEDNGCCWVLVLVNVRKTINWNSIKDGAVKEVRSELSVDTYNFWLSRDTGYTNSVRCIDKRQIDWKIDHYV